MYFPWYSRASLVLVLIISSSITKAQSVGSSQPSLYSGPQIYGDQLSNGYPQNYDIKRRYPNGNFRTRQPNFGTANQLDPDDADNPLSHLGGSNIALKHPPRHPLQPNGAGTLPPSHYNSNRRPNIGSVYGHVSREPDLPTAPQSFNPGSPQHPLPPSPSPHLQSALFPSSVYPNIPPQLPLHPPPQIGTNNPFPISAHSRNSIFGNNFETNAPLGPEITAGGIYPYALMHPTNSQYPLAVGTLPYSSGYEEHISNFAVVPGQLVYPVAHSPFGSYSNPVTVL